MLNKPKILQRNFNKTKHPLINEFGFSSMYFFTFSLNLKPYSIEVNRNMDMTDMKLKLFKFVIYEIKRTKVY